MDIKSIEANIVEFMELEGYDKYQAREKAKKISMKFLQKQEFDNIDYLAEVLYED